MRFVLKVIFFPIKFYMKIYFHGKFIAEFYYNKYLFLFLLSHMFPWIDKLFFTENNFSLV